WAFGVVLYEMLTGERLFTGETVSDTLAAVLTRDPDWNQVPTRVRRLLQCCIEKDPKRRLRDIGDLSLLADNAKLPASNRSSRLPWTVAAIAVLAASVAGGSLWYATRPVEHLLMRLNMDLGADAVPGLSTTVVISPDGRRIVFPVIG